MKFKMNDRDWEIKEVEQEKFWKELERKQEDNTCSYFGLCLYKKQEIWIDKNMTTEQKRQTLRHELMHCYIGSYISFEDISITEDLLCDISSNSHDIIHEIVEKYFKNAK